MSEAEFLKVWRAWYELDTAVRNVYCATSVQLSERVMEMDAKRNHLWSVMQEFGVKWAKANG